MKECLDCGKCFRDNWNLSVHMSKKIKCKKVFFEKDNLEMLKNSSEMLKNSSEMLKNSFEMLKNSFEEDKKNTCSYCLNEFSVKTNLKRHEMVCKQKDDPIRQLEIEQNINPILPDSKTCCRYCDKELSRVSYLNKHTLICNKRKEYLNLLQKNKNENTFITNNITNNINNININVFKIEDLEHITNPVVMENFLNYWRNLKPEQLTQKTEASKLVEFFHEIICENPKNRNVILSDERTILGQIKTSKNKWKNYSSEELVEMTFKNSAKHLHKTKDHIDKYNPKVFKSKNNNNEVFEEVSYFSKQGFKEPTKDDNVELAEPNELRRIRTAFKVSMVPLPLKLK